MYLKLIKLSLLVFLFANPFSSIGQNSWSDWDTIYSDNGNDGILIQVSFQISNNSCNGISKNRFKYKLSGKLKKYPCYINWAFDYKTCSGKLYTMQESINIGLGGDLYEKGNTDRCVFTGVKVAYPYFVSKTSKPDSYDKEKIIYNSSKPQYIDGNKNIYRSDTITLKIIGGELGTYANWVWYKDSCGGIVVQKDTSRILIANPSNTTKYFVRAEDGYKATECVSIAIEVNQKSQMPTQIIAKNLICLGESTDLLVVGGSLGYNAKWSWYQDSIKGRKIGEGKTVKVSPSKTTIYFVRAEGYFNITDWISIKINVKNKPLPPTDITGNNKICEGESLMLTVNGPQQDLTAKWAWYTDNYGKNFIGQGKSVTVFPNINTTYYVRSENICGNSSSSSILISVDKKSTAPTKINYNGPIFRNKPVTLSLQGGSLGSESIWRWYLGEVSSKNLIGTGQTIIFRPKKNQNYQIVVIGDGSCNTTAPVKTNFTVNPAHKFHKTYTYGQYINKFLQIGYGIGLESLNFSKIGSLFYTPINGVQTINDSALYTINGIGLNLKFQVYPLIKSNYGFGIHTMGTIGTTPYIISANKKYSTNLESLIKYQYFTFKYSFCTYGGFDKIKAIVSFGKSISKYNYSDVTTNTLDYSISEYNFLASEISDELKFGIRIGQYSKTINRNSRKSTIFDLYYVLFNLTQSNAQLFSTSEIKNIPTWLMGINANYWVLNACDLDLLFIINNPQKDIKNFKSLNFDHPLIKFTISINFDYFY